MKITYNLDLQKQKDSQTQQKDNARLEKHYQQPKETMQNKKHGQQPRKTMQNNKLNAKQQQLDVKQTHVAVHIDRVLLSTLATAR